jgi:hypothetical protein
MKRVRGQIVEIPYKLRMIVTAFEVKAQGAAYYRGQRSFPDYATTGCVQFAIAGAKIAVRLQEAILLRGTLWVG